jgi:hypothetical protein
LGRRALSDLSFNIKKAPSREPFLLERTVAAATHKQALNDSVIASEAKQSRGRRNKWIASSAAPPRNDGCFVSRLALKQAHDRRLGQRVEMELKADHRR